MSEVHPTECTVEYRDIPGFPGYRVGNDGTVWTCKKRGGPKQWFLSDEWTLMITRMTNEGYLRVGLRQDRKCHWISIHSLVLELFVGPRPDGMVARHLDGTRTNNRLSNLQWSTQSENLSDRKIHGTEITGERNGLAKLTADDVRSIRNQFEQGHSLQELAKLFSVTPENIGCIIRKVTWKHVT